MIWCISALILPMAFFWGCLFWNRYLPYSSLIVATIAVSLFFVGGNVICAILVGSDATLHCVIFCVLALMCIFISFKSLIPYTLEPGRYHMMHIKEGRILCANGLYYIAALGVVENHGYDSQVCLLSEKSYSYSPILLKNDFFEDIGIILTEKEWADFFENKLSLPVQVAKYDAALIRGPIVWVCR